MHVPVSTELLTSQATVRRYLGDLHHAMDDAVHVMLQRAAAPISRPVLVHLHCWCRSGKHRSVGFSELIAALLLTRGYSVRLSHSCLHSHNRCHQRCHECDTGVTWSNLDKISMMWGCPRRDRSW